MLLLQLDLLLKINISFNACEWAKRIYEEKQLLKI